MSNSLMGLCAAVVAAVAVLPAHAGSVEVSYTDPSRFTDIGTSQAERDAHLAALTRYLKTLGERGLPADQVLRIELLDVDMAGTVRPSRRGDRRVVRGMADWPRVELRYTLARDGQELRSGTDSVTDLNYSAHAAEYGTGTSDPLRYEKRALAAWFNTHFGNTPD